MSLLLIQAASLPGPPVAPERPKTPADLTSPIQQYDCHIVDEEGSSSELVWRKEGGQGFYSEEIDEKTGKRKVDPKTGKPYAEATLPRYLIVKDSSGRLASMKYDPRTFTRIGQFAFEDDKGNRASLQADQFAARSYKRVPVVVTFKAKDSSDLTFLAGVCRVKEIEQKPLNRDPRKRAK